ncbi:MAG: M48 family metallopeptidase [Pseudomonadota bacterium]|uniref:M48 family metallopeptidase n=1 Tax=Roseovarius TaxID=74030 RepID=UPI0022A82A9D|nr:M48 family metallopeptidase [Roseovarius sp. EGI FJ00037]MCZ0812296.1 M48 family metallopeptidase [Roseovarius sp. EGI FJ00037]
MQGSVAGTYFDGQSAGRHPVEVTIDEAAGDLILSGASLDAPQRWPLARLRAQGDHARRDALTLSLHAPSDDESPRDPARLTLSDPRMITRIRARCPDLDRSDLHRGTTRKLLTRGVAALAAVALILFVILPRMADTLATLIPVEREAAFGKAVTAQIERALGAARLGDLTCEDPAGRAALDAMIARLTGGQDLQYELKVKVLDHDMLNAFAAPGGQVVVMRGLLEKSGGPDAVAAVLAHEIGHVERRDATRHALRAAGSAGLLSMLLGDVTGGTIAVFLGERLMQASYTREAEAEADAFALKMLNEAGIDSAAMAGFFDELAKDEGKGPQLPAYFATHPASADRASAARDNARAQGTTRPVLSKAQWTALKGICG